MRIAATVLDKETGKPIPFASVSLQNSEGKDLGSGTMTDSNGQFSINSTKLDQDDVWVVISHVGYEEKDFPPERFNGTTIILDLVPKSSSMEEVIITAVKKKTQQFKQSNYALPIALASAAVITIGIYFYIR